MAFPTGWGYYQAITIDATQVASALSDFPFLVTRDHLHDDVVDPSGSNAAQTDGGDIRFSSDSAGTTQLACEVVSFEHDTTTGAGDAEIQVWVKVPSVSSSVDTTIYIWFDTAGTDTQPAVTDPYGRNAVWSGFDLVSHDGGATDSSGNHTLTAQGGVTEGGATGQFGAATDFDGTDDHIDGPAALVPSAGPAMMQAWANSDTIDGAERAIFGVGESGTPGAQILFTLETVSSTEYVLYRHNSGNVRFPWSHTAGQFGLLHCVIPASATDTDDVDVYVDGSITTGTRNGGSNQTLAIDQTNLFGWGANTNNNSSYFDGKQHEVRVLTTLPANLSAWIGADHSNQSSPGTFATAGTPVAVGGATSIAVFANHYRNQGIM